MAGDYHPKSAENKRVAEAAAAKIRDVWAAQGVTVKAWIEPVSIRKPGGSTEVHYVIKSEGIPT